MRKADQIGTNPAPGVMATNPTTRPVDAPTKVGFPLFITSKSIHESKAAAEEIAEVINACTASPSAASALPALKPYQPNHRRAAHCDKRNVVYPVRGMFIATSFS